MCSVYQSLEFDQLAPSQTRELAMSCMITFRAIRFEHLNLLDVDIIFLTHPPLYFTLFLSFLERLAIYYRSENLAQCGDMCISSSSTVLVYGRMCTSNADGGIREITLIDVNT